MRKKFFSLSLDFLLIERLNKDTLSAARLQSCHSEVTSRKAKAQPAECALKERESA